MADSLDASGVTPPQDSLNRHSAASPDSLLWWLLGILGSLKLTVVLLSVSIVLVLAGTIAQQSLNMLQVKQHYFTCWIAQLRFEDFVPQAFCKHEPFTFWIFFPGGNLVGTLLFANLLAAKLTRFHMRASGLRLWGGLGLLIGGLAMMIAVIGSGSSAEGIQGQPPFSYLAFWRFLCGGCAAFWVLITGLAMMATSSRQRIWMILASLTVAVLLMGMLTGVLHLGDPSLRILWLLFKGLGVAIVMLLGCILLFNKQGANVLLHLGVALLLVGQFAYGDRQLEQRLTLVEGDRSNVLTNQGVVELAFIDRTNPDKEVVTGVPASRLKAVSGTERKISDPKLPFDVQVIEYFENASVEQRKLEDDSYKGLGSKFVASPAVSKGGVSVDQVNIAAAYVKLIHKTSEKVLGTYLVSQRFNDLSSFFVSSEKDLMDQITSEDSKTFDMGLRFRRTSKPYWIKVIDVVRVNYAGSPTPRDYRTNIRLVDAETHEDRKESIWMNNPLRYRGETFYQSSYHQLPDKREVTTLQVVQNSGWLIPYLACSITGLGLLVHFLGTLNRYLARRERENPRQASVGWSAAWPVLLAVGISLYQVPWSSVLNLSQSEERKATFDLYRAGTIPVQFHGRVMPLDAFARMMLKTISKKESLPLTDAPEALVARVLGKPAKSIPLDQAREGKIPALQWLLELASNTDEIRDLQTVRIDATEVLNELGLKRRKSNLYSLNEILRTGERIDLVLKNARKKETADLSFKERKIIKLRDRTMLLLRTATSLRIPELLLQTLSELLTMSSESDEDKKLAMQQVNKVRLLIAEIKQIDLSEAVGVIPPHRDKTGNLIQAHQSRWQPIQSSYADAILQKSARSRTKPMSSLDFPMNAFANIVASYKISNAAEFNKAVDDHFAMIQQASPDDYRPSVVALERWMQVSYPTGIVMMLYILALILGFVCLLGNFPRLQASVWVLIILTALAHTAVLAMRIVITQRPPVINLYSSAVFIGWACVLYGVIVEYLNRRGFGNVVSAACGALTLGVAYGLTLDSHGEQDTMHVLQAVLDSQFWLGTHVVCITLGYSATFLAGALGIGYLLAQWFGGDSALRRELYRMAYGVTCFAILFSFTGTVLGGLWADDSWGRFWGWDPKENGALLIVIWNVLMLHARWDKLVGPYGFACLAIGGNIITAWSWFGTNQLGIGLHSYGFTSGTLKWLGYFVLSQLILVLLGWFLKPSAPRPTT